jgi:hypothetical protein
MRLSRLATVLLLGSMITFNAPCGRLDLGGNHAHAANALLPAVATTVLELGREAHEARHGPYREDTR